MTEHIKAWNHERSIWNGHYSLDLLGSPGRGRLLDAGCGSGKYAVPLRMRGFDVVALDVSQRALRIVRERCDSRKINLDLLAANVYQIPFKEDSFDVIWCYGVLQHLLLKEREYAIAEFSRLLRKGGMMFIEVLGEEDMRYGGREVELNTFSRKNGIIYHYFNKNELERMLGGFSCRIIESRKEKWFEGKCYIRHMISAAAKKS